MAVSKKGRTFAPEFENNNKFNPLKERKKIMSHFCGLVILTPEYVGNFDDSLERYNENNDVEEYMVSEVSDKQKIEFLEYYKLSSKNMGKEFFDAQNNDFKEKVISEYDNELYTDGFYLLVVRDNEDKYVEWFKKNYKDFFDSFETTYSELGDEWNGGEWKKDEDGVWHVYSTYNPESKWDWFSIGGRWDGSIKKKDGNFTNCCQLKDIDFTPYKEDDYEDATDWLGNPIKKLKEGNPYHYTEKDVPFCIVIDGEWYERGEMGWFGCTSNEKEKDEWGKEFFNLLKDLPEDSEVTNVDFHI